MINGGGVSRRRLPLIRLEDVVGGALAVVAPPLGSFGRVIGPFPRTSGVGGVIVRAGPLVPAGQSHVAQQRRFWETNQSEHIGQVELQIFHACYQICENVLDVSAIFSLSVYLSCR